MQSANPEDLQLLERQHEYKQVINAVSLMRKAGIENVNLDIIFGIPYQTLASFQRTIDLAISLDPDHFSLYALTIESGTPMGSWVNKGLVSAPDADLAADMYELASEKLDAKGYEQYEISNWARHEADSGILVCEHNMQYWRNLPYLGCGAGAHGYAGGMRTENEPNPKTYIQNFSAPVGVAAQQRYPFPQNPGTRTASNINHNQEMKETMMMSLRLTGEGVSRAAFKDRFGEDFKDAFQSEIEQLIGSDLLEWAPGVGDCLRLTPRGRLLGNQVFMAFV
jgi:oxygen-independent coproporphyrinogen-3 oxidase